MPAPLDDSQLRIWATTEPDRLYGLADDPALSDGDLLRVARHLVGRESTPATAWTFRLAERLTVPDAPEDPEEPDGRRILIRQLAWHAAQRTTRFHIKPHYDRPPAAPDEPGTEFRACLLQEMALRWGFTDPEQDAPYFAYAERLRELGHPLGGLPLGSLRFEHGMQRGVVSPGSILGRLSPGQLRAAYPEVPATGAGARAGRTAVPVPNPVRIEAAGAPYAEHGAWDAAFYTLPRPLDPDDFNGALLAELPADCLAGLTAETVLTAFTTADDVLGDLFTSAFTGGVWGQGYMGAYARLRAWQGLYALMDLDPGVPHTEAVRAAAAYHWLRFVPPPAHGDWFCGDFTDIGFAVLDPGRTRIAVLALTDTD
ncbi:DUF6183 family protein [Streptomyces sp. NPDC051211]|uniref:DUF6183 family protein n=1 Tax=Streptomyces sp. NPDC051211 TaxID=3154643 RepID=UPI003450BA60